jgi:hypothetical protein
LTAQVPALLLDLQGVVQELALQKLSTQKPLAH